MMHTIDCFYLFTVPYSIPEKYPYEMQKTPCLRQDKPIQIMKVEETLEVERVAEK
jgi:hypothetical protein